MSQNGSRMAEIDLLAPSTRHFFGFLIFSLSPGKGPIGSLPVEKGENHVLDDFSETRGHMPLLTPFLDVSANLEFFEQNHFFLW